jgi:hypothetical protein
MRWRTKPLHAILQTLSAALIVLLPQPTHAIDVTAPLALAFVAPDGDDSHDCATPATRCSTLQHALDLLAQGGEVRIAAGSYAGTTRITRSAVVGGGYALPDFRPGAEPTVLDGQHRGTTVRIVGPGWIRIQQLSITGGLADPTGLQEGQGGGIYARAANVILDRVQVYENIAGIGDSGKGGGIYISDGAMMVARSVVASNTALRLGIVQPPPAAPTDTDQPVDSTASATSTIASGPTGSGGGIYAHNARIVLQDSQISGNRAVGNSEIGARAAIASGGGLHAEGSTIATLNTRFLANLALAGTGTSGSGGAIRLVNSRALLNRGEISDNSACSTPNMASSGGGVDILGGETLMADMALRRNSAATARAGQGGGIALRAATATTALTLTNVLLAEQRGAALALLPGQSDATARAAVRYATLVSNTIGLQAATGQTITTVNSIITASEVAVQSLAGASVALAYTDRYGNGIDAEGDLVIGPAGDLALPPGFAPANDESFRLDADSALVDRGTPITGVDTDFEGQPRAIDGTRGGLALPDLGWDELALSMAALGPTQTLFAMPGDLLTTTTWLRNIGLAGDTFQLSVDAPPGWTASILPGQATLVAHGATGLTITIKVPDTARLNTRGVLHIRAQGRTSAANALIVVDVGEP